MKELILKRKNAIILNGLKLTVRRLSSDTATLGPDHRFQISGSFMARISSATTNFAALQETRSQLTWRLCSPALQAIAVFGTIPTAKSLSMPMGCSVFDTSKHWNTEILILIVQCWKIWNPYSGVGGTSQPDFQLAKNTKPGSANLCAFLLSLLLFTGFFSFPDATFPCGSAMHRLWRHRWGLHHAVTDIHFVDMCSCRLLMKKNLIWEGSTSLTNDHTGMPTLSLLLFHWVTLPLESANYVCTSAPFFWHISFELPWFFFVILCFTDLHSSPSLWPTNTRGCLHTTASLYQEDEGTIFLIYTAERGLRAWVHVCLEVWLGVLDSHICWLRTKWKCQHVPIQTLMSLLGFRKIFFNASLLDFSRIWMKTVIQAAMQHGFRSSFTGFWCCEIAYAHCSSVVDCFSLWSLGCFKNYIHNIVSQSSYLQHSQDGAKSDKKPKMFSAVHAFASLVVTDTGSLDCSGIAQANSVPELWIIADRVRRSSSGNCSFCTLFGSPTDASSTLQSNLSEPKPGPIPTKLWPWPIMMSNTPQSFHGCDSFASTKHFLWTLSSGAMSLCTVYVFGMLMSACF